MPFPRDEVKLFCPGPTPVPHTVREALAKPLVAHRTAEFRELFLSCRRRLQPFFGSTTLPLILTASGTGAMEAAFSHLTRKDDQIAVVVGGKFGKRWHDIAQKYQVSSHCFAVESGDAPDPEKLTQFITERPEINSLYLQLSETSTGSLYDVENIASQIRQAGFKGFLIVDAVSGLMAHEIHLEKMQIDCIVSGSQKGFGLPPGLSFIAMSDRAIEFKSEQPRFYFDLPRELKSQASGDSAFTPAISLIHGLDAALNEFSAYSPAQLATHHQILAEATRATITAMNLELFSKYPSNVLTAFKIPANIDASQLLKTLKHQDNIVLAGGQDELKGKILRISHLGFVSRSTMMSGLCALGWALSALGHSFDESKFLATAFEKLKNQL